MVGTRFLRACLKRHDRIVFMMAYVKTHDNALLLPNGRISVFVQVSPRRFKFQKPPQIQCFFLPLHQS